MTIALKANPQRGISPTGTTKHVITQAMLAETRHLREQQKRYEVARQEIVALLEFGAVIEPGPLTARIEKHSQQRLSESKLSALLGADVVKRWKVQVEPTISNALKVVANDK